jgi:putative oxidoreductase
MNDSTTTLTRPTAALDIGLLVLRIGVGAAVLQAGLIKAFDYSATVGFLEAAGWRLPALAAFMVTASETIGGILLLTGLLTPLAACAVLAVMLDAWAVNVSGGAFWSEPFNVPFLLAVGAAALLFTGAGAYSVDARALAPVRWSAGRSAGLLAVAVVAAVVTWIALNGSNPIHLSGATG